MALVDSPGPMVRNRRPEREENVECSVGRWGCTVVSSDH
jgi:hypothetical protein